MKCPECGSEKPRTDNFCNHCGCRLHASSSSSLAPGSLDEKIEKLQRYLPQGIPRKIISQKSKLEGERRFVTVLFCDMEGFTNLVDRLDSEKAYRVMDQIYEVLIQSVHRFEGTVNEMTGDGIMALFGAPIAMEDAPQRALRASIEIHGEMQAFSRQHPEVGHVRMRVGIHTGLVVVGTLGNDLKVEFKAVGDTVNLASRLEKMAEPGSTYLTEETYRQTKNQFYFETVGRKFIKGRGDSVTVYKVLSAKQNIFRSRLGAKRMIGAKMIGRHKELDRLELQLIKVVNGSGSVVNIIGEAGIGKSRLVAELKNREAMGRVTALEGRAISIGKNLSFHPIIELLREWLGIKQNDDETIAFKKLKTAIQSLYPDETDMRLPFVAALLGIRLFGRYAKRLDGIEGESLEKLILKNLRELFVRASELKPLVIFIEDLHWSDESTITLLESLFGLSKSHRILFVNVFRAGYSDTGERIVESLKDQRAIYHVEIKLEPLGQQKSESLVKSILRSVVLNKTLVDQIVSRAGGNPYFIEEIVRALIDEKALLIKDGQFRVSPTIASVIIPHTITDVLMTRIDQLEETTRDLIRIASVIGRRFLYRIVRDVAAGIETIDGQLAYLKEVQLISEYNQGGEVEYFFKHGLAQEAVYMSMLPQRRKDLHLKVARSIEKLFKGKLQEFYGVLSYHFNQGEDFSKAEEYMLKAGNEAMNISASSEALNYYKTALELYIKKRESDLDIKKIAGLEENIGIAFFNKGNFVEAVNYFERSLRSYGVKIRSSSIFLGAELAYNLARIIMSLHLPHLAEKKIPREIDNRIMKLRFKLARSLAYVDINRVFLDNVRNVPQAFRFDLKRAPVYIDVLVGTSALFAITGFSFRLSRKLLAYVEGIFKDEGENVEVPNTFYKFSESILNCLTGVWHLSLDEDFVENALQVGEVASTCGYLVWHGYAKFERGEFNEVDKIIEMIRDIEIRYNFILARLDILHLSSKMAVSEYKLSQAMAFGEEGIALAEKSGLEMRKIDFYAQIIKILVSQNHLLKADRIISESENVIQKVGPKAILPHYHGEYLNARLRYCLCQIENGTSFTNQDALGKIKNEAMKFIRWSTRHFRRRTAVGRVESYRLIGRYHWLAGDKKRAMKWWNFSMKEGQRLGSRVELVKTRQELESRLNDGKGEGAKPGVP